MSIAPDARTDVRIVRTREALREAMVALAAESAMEAITVRAIAARAGVGYATFFRHYADKDALLADVAEALTGDFFRQIAPLLRKRDRLGAARSLCAYVDERRPIYKALIAGGSGDMVRAEMLRQCLAAVAKARPAKSEGAAPEGPLDDLLVFHIVSAILNLLAWWLGHEGEIDAETMADIIDRTVLAPVAAMRRQEASEG